ncbi:DNA primase [Candidatus Phytoplasma phoenicium]|uniref:DNA primase n=1 Tax=Candidatus Phytoplasma phoenicium TaxID=198422 RepID=A0A2S8NUR8_9MOLU|nr:DNA primase [Candidatus Phytoplasma phoenicium]
MNILLAKKIDMFVLLKYLKIIPRDADISYRFPCLFHYSQSGLSASVNKKNRVYCWACEKPFDTIDIYQKKCSVSFREAVDELCLFYENDKYLEIKNQPINPQIDKKTKQLLKNSQPIISDNQEIIKRKKNILQKYSPLLNQITNFYHQQLLNNQGILNYLFESRKLNFDIIKKFKLGYSDANNNKLLNVFPKDKDLLLELDLLKYNIKYNFYYDTLDNCLVIPVLHENQTMHFYKNNFGVVTTFNPKYKALKNFSNTPIFYYPFGFSFAKYEIKKTHEVIIHEGFYDVINTHQHHIKNTIGLITIKSYLSTPIIDFFKQHNVKVIIGLDNDEAGRNNSQRLKMQLENENITNEIKNIPLKDCKDADDILKKHSLTTYQQVYM